MSSILLNGGDVRVLPIEPELCPECDERPVTHWIEFDMRGNGRTVEILRGCEPCMEIVADRLRESLPEDR